MNQAQLAGQVLTSVYLCIRSQRHCWMLRIFAYTLIGGMSLSFTGSSVEAQQQTVASGTTITSPQEMVNQYCITCHNERLRTAGLVLDGVDAANAASHPDIWERVATKLRAGSMPPPGIPRPAPAVYRNVADLIEAQLDRAWTDNPNPGRNSAVHRLNRTEYQNAVQDLLAVDLDVTSLLPGDETADGSFDNFSDALTISRAHLERYLSVARQVSRLATGLPPMQPGVDTFEVPLHVVQNQRQSELLPLGSRGGMAVTYNFPVDGEYVIRVKLRRQYQAYLVGMGWPQQLDVRLDGKLLERFTVGGTATGRPAGASYAGDGEPGFAGDPDWEKYMQITGDAHLEVRVAVEAGPRVVGVSFIRALWAPEGLPQPLQRGRVITNDQIYMDYAAVGSVEIAGPYTPVGISDTPSRQVIFSCQPETRQEERPCAKNILSRLARLAYRRPVTEEDLNPLLEFFETGRNAAGQFDDGIQLALERLLVDPDFLLRVHHDPTGQTATQRSYQLSDLDLASRLSFFLWSSLPDEELLANAESGELSSPGTLEQQTRRMLTDPRAVRALVEDFSAQWLNLRRVGEAVVDPNRYPNYDESLLLAFEEETKRFVASTVREDRSIRALLNADYTFVNERLARHYEIPGVYGSRFRRVNLTDPNQRGGLLAHGSILTTTSYPDRTSPVLRGKWLLDNLFGIRVPAPPPGVDTNLETAPGAVPASIRERLEQHRRNPTCASCHAVMDPVGFALENFDVIGGYRQTDATGQPVDATGTTTTGTQIEGLVGLRGLLLEEREQFPRTVTAKLLAYALGRPLEHYDQPAVRQIVRNAAADDYRWSSLILGIVKSPAFLTRATQLAAN
jgi:mono/diheme cytochrome c family protein